MKLNPAEFHPEMDYGEHERTYAFFLKACVVVTVIVTCLMIFLGLFVA